MRFLQAVAATALLCLASAQDASAADQVRGSWTIAPADAPGKVQFGLIRRHDGGNMNSQNDWPVSAFKGLDLATSARHDVQFSIAREAGDFDCRGFLENGEGAGTFVYTANEGYSKAMLAIGFDGIDANKQFAMAIHDVTTDLARRMKAEKLDGLDTDKL